MDQEQTIIQKIASIVEPVEGKPFIEAMKGLAEDNLDEYGEDEISIATAQLLQKWMSGLEKRLTGQPLEQGEKLAFEKYKEILMELKQHVEEYGESLSDSVFNSDPQDERTLGLCAVYILQKEGKEVTPANFRHARAELLMRNVRKTNKCHQAISIYDQIDGLMQELTKVNPSLRIPLDAPDLPGHAHMG